jgi:hypothetical protein
MTPLVTPALLKPAAPPRPASSGETQRTESARFAAAVDGETQPTPAALAAMAMMGGKPAVASRMETRRIARKLRDEREAKEKRAEEEAERPAPLVEEPAPLVSPAAAPIEKPRINLEAELAAVRGARRPPRGVGPLTAFLAQQFGQSGAFATSLSAPLKWLIDAYVRRHIPETPPPKRQTLSVS